MDIATLSALYPVASDLLRRTPQLRKWMENKAKKEDPTFLLQLQSLETISELKGTISELKDGISELKEGIFELRKGMSQLRAYTLDTAIMGAMLSNPELTPGEVKAKFITSAEVAQDIIGTIGDIAP